MSKRVNPLMQQFMQMLEKGASISEHEVTQNTLEMMQMLAKNPALRVSWLSLKETLQTIYNSLEETNEVEPSVLQAEITQRLYKNSLN